MRTMKERLNPDLFDRKILTEKILINPGNQFVQYVDSLTDRDQLKRELDLLQNEFFGNMAMASY